MARNYTLAGVYTACTAGGRKKGRGRVVLEVPSEGGRSRVSETGRTRNDMYEAGSQAGGERVQGQARQRRRAPVLEDERGEMRCAPKNGMDRARSLSIYC